MKVVACDGLTATVEGFGERRVVRALLVGDVAPGVHVFVHRGDAIRVLDDEEAEAMADAVRALAELPG
jgi:hydrogenase assembly chaperone HypC/HupF